MTIRDRLIELERRAVVDPESPGQERGLPVTMSTLAVGAIAGLLGTAGLVLVASGPAHVWLPGGILYGILASLVAGHRSTDAGRGLMWGLGTAMAVWIALAGLGTTSPLSSFDPGWTSPADSFSMLVLLVLGLGAPVGLSVGYWQSRRHDDERGPIDLTRAILVGGLAGIVAGWAFGVWMGQEDVFGTIAGIVGSSSPRVGQLVHYFVATTIGISFGVLFQRDTRGVGSSLVWGMAYGMFWWFLGGLTLLPLFTGSPTSWTSAAAGAQLGSLVGHVVYGLLLGVLYSIVDRLWLVLFYESDPLNRTVSGPGVRTLEAMQWGLLASVGGGLLFGIVMWWADILPTVAALVGRSSAVVGFLVHMGIGSVVGMTYGRLFRYEAFDGGSAVAWGLVYGLAWWFIGPLTVLPVLLGEPLAWEVSAIGSSLPSLIGHLAYGAPTGVAFYWLEQRRLAWAAVDPRIGAADRERRRDVGSPAPAVWLFTLGMGTVVIVLLL